MEGSKDGCVGGWSGGKGGSEHEWIDGWRERKEGRIGMIDG